MSSFSIKGISQLNLSLNIDNKKNIENIQIIINDLKELIDILSFRISDFTITTQEQISQNEQQLDTFVYDATIPDFSGDTGEGDTGGGDTGGGDTGGGDTGGGDTGGGETTAVVGYFD